MNKSQMSDLQIDSRNKILGKMTRLDWKIRSAEAYDADFFLEAEFSARRRNANCIMEINISYEDSYVSISVASFKDGAAEYVVYFDNLDQVDLTIDIIVNQAEDMSVYNSVHLAEQLCEKFPGKVYFFNGDMKEILQKDNIREILIKNQ